MNPEKHESYRAYLLVNAQHKGVVPVASRGRRVLSQVHPPALRVYLVLVHLAVPAGERREGGQPGRACAFTGQMQSARGCERRWRAAVREPGASAAQPLAGGVGGPACWASSQCRYMQPSATR